MVQMHGDTVDLPSPAIKTRLWQDPSIDARGSGFHGLPSILDLHTATYYRAFIERNRPRQPGEHMKLNLNADGVSFEEVGQIIERAWSDGLASGAVAAVLGEDAVAGSDVAPCPFTADPGEDSYDIVTLIAIAAAGRLAATIPERLLVRLFDEVIWPKLTARFGSSLKRAGDDE